MSFFLFLSLSLQFHMSLIFLLAKSLRSAASLVFERKYEYERSHDFEFTSLYKTKRKFYNILDMLFVSSYILFLCHLHIHNFE